MSKKVEFSVMSEEFTYNGKVLRKPKVARVDRNGTSILSKARIRLQVAQLIDACANDLFTPGEVETIIEFLNYSYSDANSKYNGHMMVTDELLTRKDTGEVQSLATVFGEMDVVKKLVAVAPPVGGSDTF